MRAVFTTVLLAVFGLPTGHALASSPSDISKADLQKLQTQAAQGDAKAQVNLGLLYADGRGVPQDYIQARQWWEKAAAQGYAKAQYNLGAMYYYGHAGSLPDYTTARQWFEKAAAQGDADAQTNLGVLYDLGYGVQQDYVTARGWYEKAAAQGDGMAQNNLGVLYVYGNGVPSDYTTARHWFEKAAAQGVVWAQFRLGEMYLDGLGGLPKNLVQAHLWLSMAVTQGNNLARLERDEVAKKMTPAQISEAQRLAQQCQTQQFKGC